jgi:hypothetical protein
MSNAIALPADRSRDRTAHEPCVRNGRARLSAPLFITDAAINTYPDLNDKRDIVQNAIDLAQCRLAQAQGVGIVLGACVPIVLTRRADGALVRKASCAVALLLARHTGRAAPASR